MDVVASQVQTQIKELLEEASDDDDAAAAADENDNDVIEQTRTFYRSCINTRQLEKRGLEPVLHVMAESGGWPVLDTNNSTVWNGFGLGLLDKQYGTHKHSQLRI